MLVTLQYDLKKFTSEFPVKLFFSSIYTLLHVIENVFMPSAILNFRLKISYRLFVIITL